MNKKIMLHSGAVIIADPTKIIQCNNKCKITDINAKLIQIKQYYKEATDNELIIANELMKKFDQVFKNDLEWDINV